MLHHFELRETQVLRKTNQMFQEEINPTILERSEFNKIFLNQKFIAEGAYGSIKLVQNVYNQFNILKESKDNESQYGIYREVAIMKKFNHSNILKVKGFYKIKQNHCLFMLTEYCQYQSLNHFVDHLKKMNELQKLILVFDIFNGIYAIHSKNIMHRDLKPQNILIDSNKNAKLCDFGFGTFDQDMKKDLAKSRKVGSPFYCAPETQKGLYSSKCDIFSFGLVIYFIYSNGENLFLNISQSVDQLRSSRRTFFNNPDKYLSKLPIQNSIKYLLHHTIVDKQKRFDTEQVLEYLKNICLQKNIKYEFKLQNSSEKKDETLAKKDGLEPQQKLVGQIIKREYETNNLINDAKKLEAIFKFIDQINNLIKQLKQIEAVDLTKIQKHILSFGVLFIVELYLQNAFALNIEMMSKNQNKQIRDLLKNSLNIISDLRGKVAKNLVKITNYIWLVKQLIKPPNLFTSSLLKCFESVKQLQAYVKQICAENGKQSFKKAHEVQSDQEYYEMIKIKYNIKIEYQFFTQQFDQMMQRYNNNQSKNKELRFKFMQIIKKAKKIRTLVNSFSNFK